MKGKAEEKENKTMILLKAPIRVLSRARDLYVKTLLDCTCPAEGYINGGVVPPGPVTKAHVLPQSFAEYSSKPRIKAAGEVAKEFVRTTRFVVVKKRNGQVQVETVNGNKVCLNRQGDERSGSRVCGGNVSRNYSDRLGKIGRIDEDRTCSFTEEARS